MSASISISISVCIVNWNTREALRACLTALGADKPAEDVEIIVVDNASADDSAAMVRTEFPRVKLLAQTTNLMFGPGMNVAARQAMGRFVLLLNSDTEVTLAQARAMADYMERSAQVGACSPRETDAQGRLWPLPAPLPTAGRLIVKALGGRRFLRRAQSSRGPQDCLTGSCMMVRREVGDRVGYYDPGYPLYYEDADLCARIRQAGYELHVVPDVTTIHRHGVSSHKVNRGQRLIWVTEGFCRFVWKHQRAGAARLTLGVAALLAFGETLGYVGLTCLTLGLVNSLRQRAWVGPRVIAILARSWAHRGGRRPD
jgi:GT2 family glycosyltransferase